MTERSSGDDPRRLSCVTRLVGLARLCNRLVGDVPLRQGAAVDAPLVLTSRNLGPAIGGVFPRLLAAEHGAVQQAIRPEARLVAAIGRPVGLVDAVVIVTHVAAEPAEVPVGQQPGAG